MITTSKRIAISKTARYYITDKPSAKINSVWFVLHGYGQLAEDFIKYFEPIKDETTLIVAPEALNRFYIKGFSGKVGSTWMTKEDRENEIKDYINYLDAVYDDIIKFGLLSEIKITVLGFSQGTVTACRWLSKGKSKADRLILWGGGTPPDVDLELSKELFNTLQLTIVIGDKDEFISAEQIEKEEHRLKKNNIEYSLILFEGKHIIKKEILLKLFY
ncbi:MAG: dienelactone hydrolase family protein [Ignavibacteriales bacterium]|nr:dienelactone hydrolase family protein [Ignavibacteriales bacterium]